VSKLKEKRENSLNTNIEREKRIKEKKEKKMVAQPPSSS
jgi:hypothetical protein